MNDLLSVINDLKHSNTQRKIHRRIQEFKTIDTHSAEELFQELTFCILTANCNAERTIHIHSQLSECFCTDTKETLAKKLRQHGYRFPNTRAAFIVESAKKKDILPTMIQTLPHEQRRRWLVDNIKGLGYKEASHFLRNIGYDDYAIIDTHILDILARYRIIKQPKKLTKKNYLKIEGHLQKIARNTKLTLAELDLYLWFLETGKILK
ncbi:MAG TPA: N-glycosylase/DNA lyase [Candidatus Thermoplasmatota archaeon]|nr:N-glycosylase/DNA lyase [Candidatus Thermoplasmatota archaeon]